MKNKKTIAIATAAMSLTTVVPAFAAEKAIEVPSVKDVDMNLVNGRSTKKVSPLQFDETMRKLNADKKNPKVVGQIKNSDGKTTDYIIAFDEVYSTEKVAKAKETKKAIEEYLNKIKDIKVEGTSKLRYTITEKTTEYKLATDGKIVPSETKVTVQDNVKIDGEFKTEDFTFANVDTDFTVTEDTEVKRMYVDMAKDKTTNYKSLRKAIYEIEKDAKSGLKVTTSDIHPTKNTLYVKVFDKSGETLLKTLTIYSVDTKAKLEKIPVNNDFTGHWAEDAIVEAMLNGDVTIADKFRANEQITRAEFASMIQRTFKDIIPLKNDNPNFKPEFTDVSKGDWFAAPIVALTEAGLINGYGDGTFRPNEIIKRQEAAVILAAIDKGPENGKFKTVDKITTDKDGNKVHHNTITQFADDKQIPVWADEAVQYLVNKKVVSGYNDNTFRAANSITRAESVLMAQNVKAK